MLWSNNKQQKLVQNIYLPGKHYTLQSHHQKSTHWINFVIKIKKFMDFKFSWLKYRITPFESQISDNHKKLTKMKDLEITPRKTNKKDIDDRKEEIQGQDFVKLKNRDGTKNNSMK